MRTETRALRGVERRSDTHALHGPAVEATTHCTEEARDVRVVLVEGCAEPVRRALATAGAKDLRGLVERDQIELGSALVPVALDATRQREARATFSAALLVERGGEALERMALPASRFDRSVARAR